MPMTEARLATDLYVSAHIRIAMREGIPMTVTRRGDPSSGSLILKINLLNKTARVLIEARYEGIRVWTPATHTDPMNESEAEIYLQRQAEIDPDAWLIEIEDKQGRIWFPGKVITL
jgi:hypothetical protein